MNNIIGLLGKSVGVTSNKYYTELFVVLCCFEQSCEQLF